MKRKGFTLIELLAVIVILAVIALITMPIISNVITNVRIKALENSAHGLIEESDLYYAQYGNTNNIRFDITNNKIESKDTSNLLKYKGNIKTGTVILDSKGKVTICITDGNNSAYKNYNEEKVTTVKGKHCNIRDNSSIVYLDDEATIKEYDTVKLTELVNELQEKVETLENEKASNSDLSALDTKLSADISQLKSDIGDIDDKIYTPISVSVSSNFSIATANTWTYSGATVTIPANSYYVLFGYGTYGNFAPKAVGFTSDYLGQGTTNIDVNVKCASDTVPNRQVGGCTFSGVTGSNSESYFLWLKYGGPSSRENGYIKGFYLQKQS